MSLSRDQVAELRLSLQRAVIDCSERCLYQSSKWAAELLNSIPGDDIDEGITSFSQVLPMEESPTELILERHDLSKYLMAKSLFDCREFRRCASVFLPEESRQSSAPDQHWEPDSTHDSSRSLDHSSISLKSLFLALYALLIAGEKQKTERRGAVLSLSDGEAITNLQLPRIKYILQSLLESTRNNLPRQNQGWLEYLYGQALAKDLNDDDAVSWLLKSVSIYPWNWGAWQELASLIRDAQHLNQVQSHMKPSIMAFIFSVHCRLELQQVSRAIVDEISQLQSVFPHSLFLESQRALAFYRMKDLYEAKCLFSKVLASDPRRLDSLDHYSNVLHTLESRDKLAFLAQIASGVDNYRPESCVIIGNYYSLCSRPEDAVTYFKRALMLDRNFSSAWTLLGHEYLKLQNTHAAIESYLNAVRHHRQDYRALFGLGQAYEALDKQTFSLYYYRRAIDLRPRDRDLWQVVAGCLQRISRLPEAINALKMALSCTSTATTDAGNHLEDALFTKIRRLELLFQFANIYEESKNRREATAYLEVCLDEAGDSQGNDDGTNQDIERSIARIKAKALLLLSQWAMEDGDYPKARWLARQIEEDSELAEEAQQILSRCIVAQDPTQYP